MKTIKFSMAILATLILGSCTDMDMCQNGSGRQQTKTLVMNETITGFDLRIASNVVVRQGDKQSITLTGHTNVVEAISTDIENGIWAIDFEKGCFNHYEIDVEIVVENLDFVAISGTGDIKIMDFNDQKELDITISGSGEIELHRFDGIDFINTSISGSGDIIATETINVERSTIGISGSANYMGYPIVTKSTQINISGSGYCEVTADSTLDIQVSGSAEILYKGEPHISQRISGSASIKPRN